MKRINNKIKAIWASKSSKELQNKFQANIVCCLHRNSTCRKKIRKRFAKKLSSIRRGSYHSSFVSPNLSTLVWSGDATAVILQVFINKELSLLIDQINNDNFGMQEKNPTSWVLYLPQMRVHPTYEWIWQGDLQRSKRNCSFVTLTLTFTLPWQWQTIRYNQMC